MLTVGSKSTQVMPSVLPSRVILCASEPDDIVTGVRDQLIRLKSGERTCSDVPQFDHSVRPPGRQQRAAAEPRRVDALLVGFLR